MKLRIAIVGSGISGMLAAWILQREHEIALYELEPRIGGHTHTHEVEVEGQRTHVDTGFIVFNARTYPNFIALLEKLEVPWQDSDMSFSVRCERSGLEYNGHTLNTLFAQRSNLLNPGFLGMLREILRFNREAPELLADHTREPSLGEFLEQGGYSRRFREHYALPMGAAIWSTGRDGMLDFPARTFIEFLQNHGMLSVNERPVWRTIQGGSLRYAEKLTAPYRERIRLGTPAVRVRRDEAGVWIECRGREPERFDRVVLACHSDQALALLAQPTALELEVLSRLRYQENEAVLHTDAGLMPKRKLAWAAWNYQIPAQPQERVALTYWMNRLQRLETPRPLLVTLNRSQNIDPACVLKRLSYQHPLYTLEARAARARQGELNGPMRTHYCGAYWGYGFHEDGVKSALVVAQAFGLAL